MSHLHADESLVERVYDELADGAPRSAGDLRLRFDTRIDDVMNAADALVARGWVQRKLIHARNDLYRYVYSIARTKRAA